MQSKCSTTELHALFCTYLLPATEFGAATVALQLCLMFSLYLTNSFSLCAVCSLTVPQSLLHVFDLTGHCEHFLC